MLQQYLKQLYQKLPLSLGLRHKVGQLRRRVTQRQRALVDISAREVNASVETHARLIDGAEQGQRDYFVFGVIDWHFRYQRPQQLAHAVARSGARVFYISVNFVDSAEPGFSMERLDPKLGLYQIQLHLPGAVSIYENLPSTAQLAQLRASLRCLMDAAQSRYCVNVINHPFWFELASFVPSAISVYDCMDFHAGFSNTAQAYEAVEQRMLATCDLTIVTSGYLQNYTTEKARHVELIRNGCDFGHFHQAYVPTAVKRDAVRPVVGYYGAIAEWFDVETVAFLAKSLPHCDFQMIGNDTAGVGAALRHLPNVTMYGEKPYAELPEWLAQFDVCLIPFKVTPLTLATNPVKVYEYLCVGKPVVSTALPEIAQFGDLVYQADSADRFLQCVRAGLDERLDMRAQDLTQRRIAFVKTQTWEARAADLTRAIARPVHTPQVSVVVVSYNQWHLTQRCLESLSSSSDYDPLEIIVVDNASKDDTPQQLQVWKDQDPLHRQIILNAENLGFGAGVNLGLAAAQGDYLVILNNDTVVSPGWIRGMRRHFEADDRLGILCPVTNNIGNEAQVCLPYGNLEETFAAARHYTLGKTGEALPLDNVAFFCVMLPRTVYTKLGGLDERFFPGFFEDDDYCQRVRQAGWTAACAEDVFVFHELSASFGKEEPAHRKAIFDRNKRLYEEKWGAWKPHVYRAESTQMYPHQSPIS